MYEQFGRHRLALGPEMFDGVIQVGRVPIDDGGDHQIQAGGPELLGVLVPVGNAALFDSADHLSQRLALPAFVQARLAKLAELR